MVFKRLFVSLSVSALLFCGLFIFCSKHSDNSIGPDIYKSTVTGRVVDKNGAGLNGVLITSEPLGYTTVANATGNFTLSGLPAKNYRLRFHLLDYIDTVSDSVNLGMADTQDLQTSIHMKYRFGTIIGNVTDKSGNPVIPSGVTIEMQPVSGQTVSQGHYGLFHVEPGVVRVFSATTGKGYGYKDVIVNADDTVKNANIVLDHDGGVITGTVLNAQQQPVAGATVTAVGGALVSVTSLTGTFKLTEVPSTEQCLLSINTGTDSMKIGVCNVLEGGTINLNTVVIRPTVAVQNNMVILPTDVRALSTDSSITLMISATTSGTTRIAGYQWDIDNNSTWDNTTVDPRLTILTPAAGTRTIKVRSMDTSGVYSNTATINLVVAAPPQLAAVPTGLSVSGVTASTISLQWNSATNAQGYELYRQSVSGGWDTLKDVPNTFYTDSALTQNTTYNYRIAAFNSSGRSAQTTTVSGKTAINTTLSTPVQSAPANGIGVGNSPTLTWGTISGALSYRVQVSTNSGFASFIVDDSTLTIGSKALSGLANNGTTYFWRVNAKSSSNVSVWSTTWSFSMNFIIPATPILLSPASSSTGIAVSPTLTWSTVTNAVTYRVQVSTSSVFSTIITDDSTISVGTATLSTILSSGTKYFWRINAKNSAGTSSWSTLWNYTTGVSAPSAPSLSVPVNGASGVSVTPTLTWNTVANAVTYRIQVSTSSNFAIQVADDSTLTSGTKTLSTALASGTSYYWRVNAKSSSGISVWSSTMNFTTYISTPVTPTLSSPANAATNVSTTPTILNWSTVSGAAMYRVQVSTVSSFATTIVEDSTLTLATKSIIYLNNNSTYYWRVNAKNSSGSSAWSSVYMFITSVAAPAAPVLTSPLNAASGVTTQPTLIWGTVAGAYVYRVQVSTISTFGTTVVDDSTLTSGSRAITGLLNVKSYYWRVNAKNSGGSSIWSTIWNFITQ
jgi:hypothetical protein